MRLIWAPEARCDRIEIFDYIEARNPHAAVRLDELFENAAEMLARSPYLGHPGDVAETREWKVHRNYRLIYEITPDAVHILVVMHAARRWPLQK